MRIFEIVKENVNLREAAELYGIDVNRYRDLPTVRLVGYRRLSLPSEYRLCP